MPREAGGVPKRDDHADRAALLRRVLDLFPSEEDKPSDRVIRRRAEGAVMAEELAAGEPGPRQADPEESRQGDATLTDGRATPPH